MRLIAPCLLVVAGACAPSLRMVHQSNAYFERCHAADFDPTVRPDLRRQCWARWLEHYTYGQPPDRIDYARARLAALEDGETIEPLPGMRSTAVGSSYTASFLTTAAEEPDAPADEASDAIDPAAETEETASSAPAEPPPPPDVSGACASVCGPRWNECIAQCDGRPDSCEEACVTEHRTCMRGCY